jgi:sugar lactone lactonase YvrE
MTRALIITITAIMTSCVFLAGSVSAHPAWGIAVDRNNQIYFSDLEAVWKIDAQGKLGVFRAGVSGRHTHDLNVDEDGNLYGADNSYEPSTQRFFSAVWKMTPAGGFSYLLAPTDDPPEGTSIWKDRDGNMYHATNYPERELLVLKRTPNGNVTVLVGSSNALRAYRQGAPYSVGGMAFGTDGALYLTDGANLRKVTADGRMTMLARNIALENPSESPMSGSPATRLFGIVVDAQGNVFAADNGNRRVLKVTSSGTISTVARAERPWSPTGVALKDGNLYILEFGFTPPSTYTPRVRKLSPDGRITTLAAIGENGNPAVVESTSGGSFERSAESQPSMAYVLFGAGAGIFALTVFIWRRRRRVSAHQPSALK